MSTDEDVHVRQHVLDVAVWTRDTIDALEAIRRNALNPDCPHYSNIVRIEIIVLRYAENVIRRQLNDITLTEQSDSPSR